MDFILKYIVPLIISYLFGSINFSIIIIYLMTHKDIRSMGSGNAGGTNVARNYGMLTGVVVALLDIFKCFGAVMLLKYAFNFDTMPLLILAGIACVTGHVFPIFFKFKGGKGVASSAGMLLAVSPISLAICLAVFVVAVVITRYVSLGSCLAALAFPITVLALGENAYSVLLAAVVGISVIFMHRKNIKKLMNGTENKLF